MADFPKLPRIKQDDENMEKIHCAARRGQTELVRRLVSTGIDPSIPNKFGCTALHLACKHGQIGATRELSAKAELSGVWHGQKPLHLAVRSGNVDVITTLIEAARAQGRDIAGFVNECDEYEMFEVNGVQKHVTGQTALHVALLSRNMNLMKLLLSLGASATAKDKLSETPLMRCIEFGWQDEFDLLVAAPGVRLETCDRAGRTHLHWALNYNRPEMAKHIFETGHDVNLEDQDKETPWMTAAYAGMPALADAMLSNVDPFALQQAPFHNGVQVQPERIAWKAFCNDEAVRGEVVKVLQKRLDAIVKGGPAGQKKPTMMQVAPSAPVKK